ncbi:ankyrin repeat domain-containing protein [Nocardia transvalensis]|uniref:ankyrin repeat domain-containing protein n=1 Tax=Nocardia transvalensis TaxID=37333 RepID=UPI0018952781|nr:ankyrin repeat domain-containing protein [Nocardia transvalensis]MBF6329360.1 ankyrin repeat domain-containing protein [Nocardia transvalensis]
MSVEWCGIGNRDSLKDTIVAHVDALADAGRDGDWPRLFDLLSHRPTLPPVSESFYPNASRVGGMSGYAPLHQAAWHGAPTSVVEELIRLGAWRTLRCASGETPLQVAESRGHGHLREALAPQPVHEVDDFAVTQLECQLHAVVAGRALRLMREARITPPQLGPLTEARDPRMWFPVPGMYGGFQIVLVRGGDRAELDVQSWCRIVEGSGQRHRVRTDGFELVAAGFV